MKNEEATLGIGGNTVSLPIVEGTEGDRGLDINRLRDETGVVTLDYGYANTATMQSSVSFVDGEAGELRYRGYPIEQLAEQCTFLETSYLLLMGELPTRQQLDTYVTTVTRHTLLNEEMIPFFRAFPKGAHPMAILSAAISALSTYYQEYHDPDDPQAVEESARRLIAKMPTLAAFAYKKSVGQPFIYPRNDLDYTSNFFHMTFAVPTEEYEVDPLVARALDVLLLLHADHGQNASTSTVRLVGSTKANLFTSIAAGISALWGPLHGGANQAVVEMLSEIHESGDDLDQYITRAKDRDDPFRLMGFGHRVYKNYDPRARILKGFADEILKRLGSDDPLIDVARKLEEAALGDDYFVERRLYPNVDFYSGIIFRAMGFPGRMFTALFAIGRLPGWIAQWKEMIEDPTTRLGRPRQIYKGPTYREVVPVDDR